MIEGVLLDIDGVLTVSWEPIAGAPEAVAWLRRKGVPFRLVTNTTTHSRRDLAATLGSAGIEVEPGEIVTAVVGTAAYLRSHHRGAKCFLLSDGDASEDLEGIELSREGAEVVVIGGACEDFSYANVNSVFGLLSEGAALIAMHRNLYWRTSEGLQLDSGAYVAGLEEAAGVEAVVCGKPSRPFFEEAVGMLGVPARGAAMVGDDMVNDVLGAQEVGLHGVLVRTGKFRAEDLQRGRPDDVIGSIAELPALIERSS